MIRFAGRKQQVAKLGAAAFASLALLIGLYGMHMINWS